MRVRSTAVVPSLEHHICAATIQEHAAHGGEYRQRLGLHREHHTRAVETLHESIQQSSERSLIEEFRGEVGEGVHHEQTRSGGNLLELREKGSRPQRPQCRRGLGIELEDPQPPVTQSPVHINAERLGLVEEQHRRLRSEHNRALPGGQSGRQ